MRELKMKQRVSRKRLRKDYIKKYGPIPEGHELHHIVPIWDGGEDSLDNITAVSWEEHKKLHHERYLKNNDLRDLMASKIGLNEDKIRKMYSSLGGKIGGRIQKEKKLGIHAQTREERLKYSSLGGKASPAFKSSKIQSELGKRGGPKNKGFVWLTDGKNSIKYSKKLQNEKTVEEFIKENPSFRIGRTETKKTCEICGKTLNARTIKRYHNNRCKYAKNKIN